MHSIVWIFFCYRLRISISLPDNLYDVTNTAHFKRRLKTHFYSAFILPNEIFTRLLYVHYRENVY